MKNFWFAICFLVSASLIYAQGDTTVFVRIPNDTNSLLMNMDAVYNRPFLKYSKLPPAVGGYVEANSIYKFVDGINNGVNFEIPRLTVFIASSISKRIKFLSEIEFEGAAKKINIDFAALDINFHPLINFRGGVILNPIGAFNQNHDGPKYEFINRPLASTTIVPGVWCNAGFGLNGKYVGKKIAWGYEAYVTNGFNDRIIANDKNRTWLSESKVNPERLLKSFNGVPLVSFKTAIRHRKLGELGLSWMGGVYNKFELNNVNIDRKRRIDLIAVDFNTTFPSLKTRISGEWIWTVIDIPDTYTQQFGDQQQGGYIDIVQPIFQKKILDWENATINLSFRAEFADYNVGTFVETGENISDHVSAVAPGISFRPSPSTIIRFNYRYQWQYDLFGNPPTQTTAFQFGLSTYF